jgi:hypothetical protein
MHEGDRKRIGDTRMEAPFTLTTIPATIGPSSHAPGRPTHSIARTNNTEPTRRSTHCWRRVLVASERVVTAGVLSRI